MDQDISVPGGPGAGRPERRPRYILGTFWLGLGVLSFFYAADTGRAIGFLMGPAFIAYSIYLYRGGRFGFIIW